MKLTNIYIIKAKTT